jgi:hypothetical protein
MSRTFRYRHLPTRAGGYVFKHVVEGHHRNIWDRRAKAFEAIYGPRPTEYQTLIKHGTHREWVVAPRPSWWTKHAYVLLNNGHYGYAKRAPWGTLWDHKTLVDLPGSWRPTHEYFEYNRAKDLFEREYVNPVMTWHPYARRRCSCCYGYDRRESNRSARRANKVLAKYADQDTIFMD